MDMWKIEVGVKGSDINQKYESLHKIAVDTKFTRTYNFMYQSGFNTSGMPKYLKKIRS